MYEGGAFRLPLGLLLRESFRVSCARDLGVTI